jgi:hypothetical protein
MHLIVRSNPDTPPGAIRALRLIGAPTPSISRETEERMRANPWPEDCEQGPIFFLLQCNSIDYVISCASNLRSSPRKRGPGLERLECLALGPRFRGDERREQICPRALRDVLANRNHRHEISM